MYSGSVRTGRTVLFFLIEKLPDFFQMLFRLADANLVDPLQLRRVLFRMADVQAFGRTNHQGGAFILPPADVLHLAVVHVVTDGQSLGHPGVLQAGALR